MSKKQNLTWLYENIQRIRNQQYHRGVKPIIGIDIGSSHIKMVKMKKNNRIGKWVIGSIPTGVINQGRIEAADTLVETINKLRKANRFSGGRCALSISGNEVVVRELVLPVMGEDQIMENIKHEITNFLPLGHDEYSIDYKILDYIKLNESEPETIRIMVAAMPKRLVQSYVETLKRAKFKVAYIDVQSNIASKLSRWAMHSPGNREKKDIAIIDFGSHTTNITILKNGNYFMHKVINNGGEYITSIISDKLNVDFGQAEEIKNDYDFFNNKDNIASQHIVNHFEYFVLDIERVLEFFRNQNSHKNVDQIYIMGGGSLLKGLPTYLEKRLDIKVFPLSEVLEMFRSERNQVQYIAYLFNAIGATMREER